MWKEISLSVIWNYDRSEDCCQSDGLTESDKKQWSKWGKINVLVYSVSIQKQNVAYVEWKSFRNSGDN